MRSHISFAVYCCCLASQLGDATDEADCAGGEGVEVGRGDAGGGEDVCHFWMGWVDVDGQMEAGLDGWGRECGL